MSDQFLDDRRRSLEEAFFAQQNRKTLDTLRAKLTAEAERAELTQASGISDPAVLDQLRSAGISGEMVTALALVPLVEVAWADGELSHKERDAILAAAAEKGVTPGTHGRDLLDSWLASKPGHHLLDAWRAYVQALCAGPLAGEAKNALRDEVLGRARAVAEAAGGFLGLAAISDREERMLGHLAEAFE